MAAKLGVAESATLCEEAAKSLGYQGIRREQQNVIINFLNGRDVFAVLPTGYGKSLCFACLPYIFDKLYQSTNSIIVVITPLTAIINDQVASFCAKGLPTANITGDQDDANVLEGVQNGEFKVVFFTPEIILSKQKWRELLLSESYTRNLRALVVDEAHTIKKWGESFRKILLRIGELRSLIPESVNIMALTATATKTVREDVTRIVGMRNPVNIIVSPSKSNITYIVRSFDSFTDAFCPLLEDLKRKRSLFPVYCRRFIDCGNLYTFFRDSLGNSFTEPVDAPDLPQFRLVDMYLSCTDKSVKDSISKLFLTESHLRIVITTVAFGMGVDCPDVYQVIHLGPPVEKEEYIQETGRAGRDGLQSIAVLYLVKGMRQHVDEGMKQYIMNKEVCRRNSLFCEFEGYANNCYSLCKCCDVYACKCTCSNCK